MRQVKQNVSINVLICDRHTTYNNGDTDDSKCFIDIFFVHVGSILSVCIFIGNCANYTKVNIFQMKPKRKKSNIL